MKRPQQREPARDRERCRDCPLFEPTQDWQGNDMNAPVFDDKGERVVKGGIPLLWKHKDGALVRWGMCGAELPRRDVINNRAGTSMREVRTDWFCESPEKHAALERMRKEQRAV